MQSKTTRGVRHLLVSTGVISLVLSVAAPAALADADKSKGKSEEKAEQGGHADNEGTGTTRVLVCHNGAVLEVDDDGGDLGGHLKHGDALLGPAVEVIGEALQSVIDGCTGTLDSEILDGDLVVDVCRDGILIAVLERDVLESDVEPEQSDDALTCPGGIIVDGDKTTVCVDGVLTEVVEVPEGAVPAVESEDGLTCPGEVFVGGDKVEEVEVDPVVVVDEPVVLEVPVESPPATPVQPIPAAQPRPVVNISTDTVTKPVVPARPASPAAAPKADQNEVLGAVTTRTPTPGVGALDPGTHTAASITALAATGADGTKVLAVVGVILLLSGFGLQVSGRRRMRSAMVEA